MATTISQARTAIAQQLATVSGLNVYAKMPSLVTLPAAVVWPTEGSYDFAFGGVETMKFDILLMVDYATLEAAQDALDAYLDTSNIRAVVETDRTLGGQVASLSVNGWTSYGRMDINGVIALGARLLCEVWPLT